MNKQDIEELAHRTCSRYRKSNDPGRSDTYKFSAHTLVDFAIGLTNDLSAERDQALARARLLAEQLDSLACQYLRCGCGHNACNICQDRAETEEIIGN